MTLLIMQFSTSPCSFPCPTLKDYSYLVVYLIFKQEVLVRTYRYHFPSNNLIYMAKVASTINKQLEYIFNDTFLS
jgi:hypothetical protein